MIYDGQHLPNPQSLSFEDFKRFLLNLEMTRPRICSQLLREMYGIARRSDHYPSPARKPSILDMLGLRRLGEKWVPDKELTPESIDNEEYSKEDLDQLLRELYDAGAAKAIGFLFDRADRQTRELFARFFLTDEEAAGHAQTDVLVMANDDPQAVRATRATSSSL